MIVEMKKFGTALSTRASGRRAYDLICSQSNGLSGHIIFDFSDVNIVSNSFADELFGRLTYEFGMDAMRDATSFVGVKPLAARIIRSAMNARSTQRGFVTV